MYECYACKSNQINIEISSEFPCFNEQFGTNRDKPIVDAYTKRINSLLPKVKPGLAKGIFCTVVNSLTVITIYLSSLLLGEIPSSLWFHGFEPLWSRMWKV